MKELLSGDCGQHNPVLRVASHFAGSGASGSASLDPVHLVGRSSNHVSYLVSNNFPCYLNYSWLSMPTT